MLNLIYWIDDFSKNIQKLLKGEFLIESFLTNRTQDMIFDSENSTYVPVESGVTQGFV